MFKCKCGMTFLTLRELLVHFVVNEKCRWAMLDECLERSAGIDTFVMVFDTCLGEVDKWLPNQ